MEQLKLKDSDFLSEEKGKTTRDKVKNTYTEELFLGICAPIGSMKDEVISSLTKILHEKYGYEVRMLKLTDYIDRYKIEEYRGREGETEAYSKLIYKINEGNQIREKYSNKSVLVELAIQDIHIDRMKTVKTDEINPRPEDYVPRPEDYKSRRICFIFNSIKNEEELLLLRQIYTDNFYQFSIFSPEAEREQNLIGKGLSVPEVKKIVQTDEYDNSSYGQNVRGTFVEGDFFLRVSEKNVDTLDKKIIRYLNLIFGSAVVTPTSDEIAMYAAKSAAGNSSCLSRQVGAAITNNAGNLISTGWNDVPKFGGNLYSEGDINDTRCIVTGYCSNDSQKDIMVNSIVEMLKGDSELSTIFNDSEGRPNLGKVAKFTNRLRNSKIKDLIEFSRSVHAEMHAIISGSQLSGDKMVGGKLFCTTYPCHNCAKHIIASGIKEVYYIEPYIKSLCIILHNDAITEDENDENKVRILIFDGVAPKKYLNFFTKISERKDKFGKITSKDYKTITPKIAKSLQALPTLETQAIHSLEQCGILKV